MKSTDTDKQPAAAETATPNDYEDAQRRAFALLDSGFHLGGKVTTTRDELHDRFDPLQDPLGPR